MVNLLLGQGNDYLDITGTLDPAPFVSAQSEFVFSNVRITSYNVCYTKLLRVEGGPAGADRSLTAGVKLPGEKDAFLIAIGAQPPESQQIDVLNIYNDSSLADTSGVMDQTTLRGFGMADA